MGALVVFIFIACSNQRNTWVSRNYQQLVSHYNIFHNGEVAFYEGIDAIRNAYKNDYSFVLPVYEFSELRASRPGNGDMETALQKGHKLIQLHSITVKPERKNEMTDKDKRFFAREEFNDYVDDAYLLIGKANVVKHEEDEAIEVFDYISRKFTGNPSSYEAKIWKSIAYTQIGQYTNAVTALESYDVEGLAPQNLYGQYMTAYANIYISQEKYPEAVKYMEEAVKDAPDRHSLRRYKYILAQLYSRTGEKEKAAPLFLELSKTMADYDMAFAAKLDLATVATTPEALLAAEKKLQKMAADDKNSQHLDQIYYAIGKLDENKGLKAQALEDYQKSIDFSEDNVNQKGLSYLAQADIYIARPEYIPASAAFDSAAIFLDESNFRSAEVKETSAMLQPLANELQTVVEQDSLLRIANMPAKEREDFIEELYKAIKKAERERQEAAEAALEDEAISQSEFYQLSRNTTGQKVQWYFYNTNTVAAGKSQFIGKWGRRPNEDNWRRADKSSTAIISDSSEELSDSSAVSPEEPESAPLQPSEITQEVLMAGLPLTAERQAEAKLKIDEALFNSGLILYDGLHDYATCATQLTEHTSRFPQSNNRYNALVLLYFSQTKINKPVEAQQTAAIIKREFPESSFAQYLASANYFDSEAMAKAEKEARYEQTYHSFLKNEFASAIASASSFLNDANKDTTYESKYLLVRSLSYAKTANTPAFRSDLTAITQKYPGTPEDSLAQALLEQLAQGKTPVRSEVYKSPLAERNNEIMGEVDAENIFVYNPDTSHTVICLIDDGLRNEAQFAVADYNFSNYLVDDLDIRVGAMADGRSYVAITGFANETQAQTYFYAVREQKFWKELTSASIPEIYYISDNNLRPALLTSLGKEFQDFFNAEKPKSNQ